MDDQHEEVYKEKPCGPEDDPDQVVHDVRQCQEERGGVFNSVAAV